MPYCGPCKAGGGGVGDDGCVEGFWVADWEEEGYCAAEVGEEGGGEGCDGDV